MEQEPAGQMRKKLKSKLESELKSECIRINGLELIELVSKFFLSLLHPLNRSDDRSVFLTLLMLFCCVCKALLLYIVTLKMVVNADRQVVDREPPLWKS